MSNVVERPLLSRAELIASVDPATSVSDRVFRRLQSEGVITRGVTVHPRAGARAKGTVVLFSTLNRDALALHRRGLADEAREMQREAATLEDRLTELFAGRQFAAWVRHLGESLDPDPIGDLARFWPEETFALAEQTTRARHHHRCFAHTLGLLLFAGKVGSLHEAFAEVVSERDEPMLVPREDLRRVGLDFEGAQVLVRMEELLHGRLLQVEPALVFERPDASPAGLDDVEDDDEMPRTLRLARTPVTDDAASRLRELLGMGSRVRIAGPLPITAR